MLSQKEYAAKGGLVCPHCGSKDLVGHQVDLDVNGVFQEVTCQACGAMWTDVYKLTGFDNFEKDARARLEAQG